MNKEQFRRYKEATDDLYKRFSRIMKSIRALEEMIPFVDPDASIQSAALTSDSIDYLRRLLMSLTSADTTVIEVMKETSIASEQASELVERFRRLLVAE